jgi:putative heme transporter
LIASRLTLVIVPIVLALFPATLLLPVADWLKHRRWPPALAALVTLVGAITIVGLVIGLMVPLFVAQIPELTQTASTGLDQLDDYLTDGPLGLDLGGLAGVIDQAREQFGGFGTIAGPALDAATAAFEIVAGSLLLLVVLFFFLKDGMRIGDGLLVLVPQQHRPRTRAVGRQAFTTLGAFFRGQLLIALVDAIGIGIGLVLLRVPLALPLAVVVFFGGLFPIVGALTAGTLAVLVALAHGGLGLALAVTALIVGVQQLEGNVLEPLILSRVVRLPALIVVLAITAGAVTLGVLGAFLAVPIAAVVRETASSLAPARTRDGSA